MTSILLCSLFSRQYISSADEQSNAIPLFSRKRSSAFLWQPRIAGCGHIYFYPVVSSFFFFFISSPDLSGRTSDVYHTSTHSVALVRI